MQRRNFCLAVSAQLAAQTVSWPDEADALIGRAVDEGRVAGAVVQVDEDGRNLLRAAKGWRDLEERTRMTVDTIFDMRFDHQTRHGDGGDDASR